MLYISVGKKIIDNNRSLGRNDPPFEIRLDRNDHDPMRVSHAEFTGTIRLRHDDQHPLPSGAVCWVEIEQQGAARAPAASAAQARAREVEYARTIAAPPPPRRSQNPSQIAPPGRVINVSVSERSPIIDGFAEGEAP